MVGTDRLLMLPQNLALYAQKLYASEILEVPFKIPDFPLDMVWHMRLDRDPCHAWFRDQIITICQDDFAALH